MRGDFDESLTIWVGILVGNVVSFKCEECDVLVCVFKLGQNYWWGERFMLNKIDLKHWFDKIFGFWNIYGIVMK